MNNTTTYKENNETTYLHTFKNRYSFHIRRSNFCIYIFFLFLKMNFIFLYPHFPFATSGNLSLLVFLATSLTGTRHMKQHCNHINNTQLSSHKTVCNDITQKNSSNYNDIKQYTFCNPHKTVCNYIA